MASPLDDRHELNLDHTVHQRVLSQFRGDWVSQLKVEQLFILIDGVLPFEACLYYQVLPLFVEGNRLHLGMVSPDDVAASEYVRRIISYLNYSLLTHPISSEALRVVLTAYLSHMGNQQTGLQTKSLSYGHHRHNSRAQIDRQVSPSERLTLVVDSPEDLYSSMTSPSEVVISPLTPPPAADLPSDQIEPQDAVPNAASSDLEPIATLIAEEPADASVELTDRVEPTAEDAIAPAEANRPEAEKAKPVDLPPPQVTAPNGAAHPSSEPVLAPFNRPSALPRPQHRVPTRAAVARNTADPRVESHLAMLNLTANYLSSPVEMLAELPPPELLQELLARMLLGGIGRLFFERHAQDGRIVWSQDGVLQSVMDQLPVSTFEGVIQALKAMANLPMLPIHQPHQTEIEYLYDRSRVLLRFRFMPSAHGEEATVQVLRGAAMKFYQQQQISKLEKDAVTIAQQLQNKLNEIRSRAYSDPALIESHSKILPRLSELLQHLEKELTEMGIHPAEQTDWTRHAKSSSDRDFLSRQPSCGPGSCEILTTPTGCPRFLHPRRPTADHS